MDDEISPRDDAMTYTENEETTKLIKCIKPEKPKTKHTQAIFNIPQRLEMM